MHRFLERFLEDLLSFAVVKFFNARIIRQTPQIRLLVLNLNLAVDLGVFVLPSLIPFELVVDRRSGPVSPLEHGEERPQLHVQLFFVLDLVWTLDAGSESGLVHFPLQIIRLQPLRILGQIPKLEHIVQSLVHHRVLADGGIILHRAESVAALV